MNQIIAVWGDRKTKMAAKYCKNANASTPKCMKRILDADSRKKGRPSTIQLTATKKMHLN